MKKANAAQAINELFENAPVVKLAPKKGKKEKEEIEFSGDFSTLVSTAIVVSALEGVKENLQAQYKEQVFEIFAQRNAETGKKPDAFSAICGEASATYRLQNPGHGFSEETAKELTEKGIGFDVQDKQETQYRINPEILASQELLGKLALFLKEVDLGVPVIQKVDVVKKYSPNESTFEGISKLESSEQQRLLGAVNTLYFVDQRLNGLDVKSETVVAKALRNLADAGILKWSSKSK